MIRVVNLKLNTIILSKTITVLTYSYLYILSSKLCMGDCFFLFVWMPMKSRAPLDLFASHFDWGTWENHGNVLSLELHF